MLNRVLIELEKMLNLNVPPAVKNLRYKMCRACKFYKPITDSCGTFRLLNPLGQKLTKDEIEEIDKDNTITYYRKKTRLCGCICDIKTKVPFEYCPIGKWASYQLTEQQLVELKAFLQTFPKTGQISRDYITQLYDWASIASGEKQKVKNCAECIKGVLREFNRQLNLMDND